MQATTACRCWLALLLRLLMLLQLLCVAQSCGSLLFPMLIADLLLPLLLLLLLLLL
jgi:hypothetical protein